LRFDPGNVKLSPRFLRPVAVNEPRSVFLDLSKGYENDE